MIKSLLDHDIQIYKINIDPYSDVGEMSKEEAEIEKIGLLMTGERA